jgi:prepilin-type N-terminal cleavage/methylation domain-containing protein
MAKLVCGFTLIELMVTMSIVTVIMSVVLFSYSKFIDRLALNSATQEMAIAIRQAQSYGLNVKEAAAGGGQFASAYGIFVDPQNDPTHYTIFVDTFANKTYDAGAGACGTSTTECVEKVTIRDGVQITKICDAYGSCFNNSSGKSVSITFLRPNPNADINLTDAAGNIVSGGSESSVAIILTSPQGNRAILGVESLGGQVQITIP